MLGMRAVRTMKLVVIGGKAAKETNLWLMEDPHC